MGNYYRITSDFQINAPSGHLTTITDQHFGGNLVTTTGANFVDGDHEFSSLVEQLGVTTLRFPGGSVTEQSVDMTAPNLSQSVASVEYKSVAITPMNEFFERSGEIEVDVTLVVPTSSAFLFTAGEAGERLMNGENTEVYGNRTTLREDYLDEVKSYVIAAMDEAKKNGVSIEAFEIGNEFWGSSVKMTAGEYGLVAGNVALAIEEAIYSDPSYLEFQNAETLVQTTRSPTDWSPKLETKFYIQYIDGKPYARNQHEYDEARSISGFDSDEWRNFDVPAQGGTPGPQSDSIADGILSVDGASSVIDGVLFHYYISGGVDDVDGGQSAIFQEVMTNFEARLELEEESLTQHVTEWNPRGGGLTIRGLRMLLCLRKCFLRWLGMGSILPKFGRFRLI